MNSKKRITRSKIPKQIYTLGPQTATPAEPECLFSGTRDAPYFRLRCRRTSAGKAARFLAEDCSLPAVRPLWMRSHSSSLGRLQEDRTRQHHGQRCQHGLRERRPEGRGGDQRQTDPDRFRVTGPALQQTRTGSLVFRAIRHAVRRDLCHRGARRPAGEAVRREPAANTRAPGGDSGERLVEAADR